jgi:hypothetical protein
VERAPFKHRTYLHSPRHVGHDGIEAAILQLPSHGLGVALPEGALPARPLRRRVGARPLHRAHGDVEPNAFDPQPPCGVVVS